MKYMDQTRTSGVTDRPAAAGSEPAAKRTVSADAPAAETGGGGCFDCNICLDSAAEPVVTLCGHLYCWPCIYEWLCPDADAAADARSSSARRGRECCPVCKAAVSPDALVPLYGRGSSSRPKKPPPRGVASVPRRPAVRQSFRDSDHRSVETQARRRGHADTAQFDFLFPPPFGDRGAMHSTTGGMLGGMAVAVLPPWVLRGQDQPPSMYFPSPYRLTPSQRRRQAELESSLHQIWFFLFVFVVLCLLLF